MRPSKDFLTTFICSVTSPRAGSFDLWLYCINLPLIFSSRASELLGTVFSRSRDNGTSMEKYETSVSFDDDDDDDAAPSLLLSLCLLLPLLLFFVVFFSILFRLLPLISFLAVECMPMRSSFVVAV